MPKPLRILNEMLERCTLRVWSRQRTKVGTGFFISPHHVVTCAHVLGERVVDNQVVDVEWGSRTFSAKLTKLFPEPCPLEEIYPDIAVLQISETDHPVVFLDGEYDQGDPISSWGYSDLRPAGESILGRCEGDAKFNRSPEGHLIKFKETQIRPGISGAPLLNERTGAVCGMIKRTRDSDSDTGGFAIRGDVLIQYLGYILGDRIERKAVANEWLRVRSETDVSFRQYLLALKRFTRSAYRVLPLPRGLDLDEVYVPLRARSLDADVVTGAFDLKGIFRNLTFSPKGRHLLLEGNPGAGKSTLLRHIAHNAFDQPTELGLDGKRIPLLIRLQSLAKSSGVSLEDRLLGAIGEAKDYELPVKPDSGFLTEWPKREDAKWLLLLDGFDEVSRDNRAEIKDFIQRLKGLGGELVVTTRPTESLGGEFLAEFNRYTIDAFNLDQQHLLAAKWFGVGADEFLNSVQANVGEFLGNTPLLLTIAASVFATDKRLPSRRVDLYKRFIDCWWEEAISRGVLSELDEDFGSYALAGLQDIAVVMTRRPDVAAVDEIVEELVDIFAQKFSRSREFVRPKAERFLEIMGRRSGIFINRGSDCEWLHRTFREYMCARGFAFLDPDSAPAIDIVKNWKGDQWRQIVLFCMSIWSERKAVSTLMKRVARLSPPYGVVLAADAIAEGAKVDEDLQREVIELLCREALVNSQGTICNRLLAGITDDSIKRADETLRALMQLRTLPTAELPFSQLVKTMVSYAREWDKNMGNAAVHDLGALRRTQELLDLANDKELRDWIRWEAAEELRKCGRSADAAAALYRLISEKTPEDDMSTRVLDELGEAEGSKELMAMARCPSMKLNLRVYAAEVLAQSAMLSELTELVTDLELEPEIRHRALVGLLGKTPATHAKGLIDQIFMVKSPTVAEAEDVVRVLKRMKSWDAILAVVMYPGIQTIVIEQCLSVLESEDRVEDLLYLVAQSQLSQETRWLAATAVRRKHKRREDKAYEGSEVLLRFYQERLNLTADDLATLKERADLYLSLGRWAAAIEDFDRIITLFPDDELSLGLRANAKRLAGRNGEAIADFDRALVLDKNDVWDIIRRGLAHWNLSHWEAAAADFAVAQDLEAKETYFYKYYADSLCELERYEEAFGVANKAIDSEFLSPMAYGVRGTIYSATARWDEAVREFSQSLMLDASYKWALQKRSIAYRCMSQFGACLDDLNSILRLSANHRWARVNRCEVSLRLRDYTTVRQDIALLSDEGSKSAWLVYLRWLLARSTYGDSSADSLLTAAKAETENKLCQAPTDVYLRSNLGIYEMAAGEFEKAVQIFDQLLAERKVAFLRTAALPEISDFVAIVPENVAAVAFYKDLLSRVEMLAGSYNLTKGEYVNQENKDDSSKYSPVYCRLYAIHGLEKEKARAEKLLSREPERRKTLVLWRVDGDWLYGHCNFKYQPEDGYNLKFLDKLETVLNRDLEIFAAAGLNRILFVEQELMDKFSANRDFDFDSFSLDYDLVKDDDPDWAAAG